MKKILILLSLLTSLVIAGQNDLYFRNLTYNLSGKDNMCYKLEYGMKAYYFKLYNDGNLLVETKYTTPPGDITETVGFIKNTEVRHAFADTYGACMFYRDVVVNKLKVDANNYVNMKEKK